MTFLPIVERELRVAARRGTTHWVRFALTAVVSLVMVNYFVGTWRSPPAALGRFAFEWLVSATFVLACAAGALTADTLSSERREGKLGLLFLTDLRAWDITLGKLASAGLGAAYAGIAFLPLLMLPLLAGGVAGLEAMRTGLALLTILLFALAAGLAVSAQELDHAQVLRRAAYWVVGTVICPLVPVWFGTMRPVPQAVIALSAIPLLVRTVVRLSSTRERDRTRALRRSAGLILGIVILPILATQLGWSSLGAHLSLLSPLTTVLRAQDTAYRAAPMEFWVSWTIQLVHAVALLFSAGRHLRHRLSESLVQPHALGRKSLAEPEPYSSDPFSNASFLIANPPAPAKREPRRPFDEARPLQWLVLRQRGQQKLCWAAAMLLIASSQVGFALQYLRLFTAGGPTPQVWYFLSHLSWVGEALLAWAACRFFFEAHRTGELELLLTTPVGAQTLIAAHWAAMKRLLRWPLMLVFASFVLPTAISFFAITGRMAGKVGANEIYSALYALCRPVELLLIVFAMTWLGVWFGLRVRRLFHAVGLTVGLTAGMTMIIHSLWQFMVPLFFTPSGTPSVGRVVWFFGGYPVGWAVLLALTVWAKHRLRHGLLSEPGPLDWRRETQMVLRGLVGSLRAWGR
ncbi:MAG: hypothetical protein HZA90_08625 [Verrucomicrobia bacterium]|nr:hypothetical protein [Verrucomicrobiota bacterium]